MSEEGSVSGGQVGTLRLELRPPGLDFAARIALRGEHDLATAPALDQTFAAICGNVLVDLSDCTFIDSTIITLMIAANLRLRQDGYRFEVVAPPTQRAIARVLEVTGLGDVMTVHSDIPR